MMMWWWWNHDDAAMMESWWCGDEGIMVMRWRWNHTCQARTQFNRAQLSWKKRTKRFSIIFFLNTIRTDLYCHKTSRGRQSMHTHLRANTNATARSRSKAWTQNVKTLPLILGLMPTATRTLENHINSPRNLRSWNKTKRNPRRLAQKTQKKTKTHTTTHTSMHTQTWTNKQTIKDT